MYANRVYPTSSGQLFKPKSVNTDAHKLLELYLKHIEYIDGVSTATVKNRRYILMPFLERLHVTDVQEISLEAIDNYCLRRREQIKQSSLDMEKQAMRGYFEYCQVRKLIELQFDYRVIRRSKQKPPRLSPLESHQIQKVVRSLDHDPQLQLIITLMANSGLRIGEIITLEVEHINGYQMQIRGKGSKDRLVPIPVDLAAKIQEYCAEAAIYTGCVFRPKQVHCNHPSDRYTSAYAVRDRIKAAFLQFNIKMHPHDLRHAFAFLWLQNGGDLRTLQLILGHDNLEVTQRYLGVSDAYLCKVAQSVIPKSIMA